MMRVISKIGFFSLLIVATLFIQSAGATVTEILPHSSHYEGSSYYPDGYVDFAVYDTLGANGNELTTAMFDDAPGAGQYIYAYQIFSYGDHPYTIDFFGIYPVGEGALAEPVNDNLGYVNDSPLDPSEEGVQPDRAYVGSSEDGTVGTWEFDSGLLIANAHSWFLLLRSDHGWSAGHYTFDKQVLTQIPVTNPEPCTLALLGLGGAMLFVRRRKSV